MGSATCGYTTKKNAPAHFRYLYTSEKRTVSRDSDSKDDQNYWHRWSSPSSLCVVAAFSIWARAMPTSWWLCATNGWFSGKIITQGKIFCSSVPHSSPLQLEVPFKIEL